MGTGNANRSGGLDRPKATEMIDGVVPEGLIKRLDSMVNWEPPDSPRAAAIREAADVLRNLPPKQSDAKRLDNLALAIKGYRIDTSEDPKEMRIVFFGLHGQKHVLGYLTFDSSEAYEFASGILRNYDELEGI